MNSPLDWLRKQPWTTRAILSVAFASLSLFAYFFAGHIWPWGILMAFVPWLLRERSTADEDFFREVKPTDDAAVAAKTFRVDDGDVGKLLARLTLAVSSGFGADKVGTVVEEVKAMHEGGEKRLQFLVMFATRPTSLQVILRRPSATAIELTVLSDARLVATMQ